MLLRSLNIRRLSFVLFAGDKNHFLTLLPSIQEKLVDILRNVTAPIVQSEVYLCIRVLLSRLSQHNLTSFWPVLLTELVRASSLFVVAHSQASKVSYLRATHDGVTCRWLRRSAAYSVRQQMP
jgi:hypothetical protein